MGEPAVDKERPHRTTAQIAAASGYSVQQVRDLERLGIIPPAERAENGYRRFTPAHLVALRAYRALAAAVGPVVARDCLTRARRLPLAEATALVSALHVGLSKDREDTLAALSALRAIQAEAQGAAGEPTDDTMTITELSDALGVRPSTLRFWEQEGLVFPDRVTSFAARRYPPSAVRQARIAAALRAAGYGVPAVRQAIASIRRLGGVGDLGAVADLGDPLAALQGRLTVIARRTVALLDAGTDLTRLLRIEENPGT